MQSLDFRMIIIINKHIIFNNTTIGVIGGDISVEELKKEIESVKLYDSGYAFLLNKDYNYIAEEITAKGYGVVDGNFGGKNSIIAFTRLYDGKVVLLAIYLEQRES